MRRESLSQIMLNQSKKQQQQGENKKLPLLSPKRLPFSSPRKQKRQPDGEEQSLALGESPSKVSKRGDSPSTPRRSQRIAKKDKENNDGNSMPPPSKPVESTKKKMTKVCPAVLLDPTCMTSNLNCFSGASALMEISIPLKEGQIKGGGNAKLCCLSL